MASFYYLNFGHINLHTYIVFVKVFFSDSVNCIVKNPTTQIELIKSNAPNEQDKPFCTTSLHKPH